MSHLRAVVAALAGTLLLGGTALAAGPYPPPSKGTGHVEPSRIKVGQCAVFSGDGFRPLTPIAVSDNGASAGTTSTDANGEFSKRLCYPSNAQRGRHNLAGSGTGSDGAPLTVHAMLIVEGVRQSASNPSTQPGGSPATGPGGTRGNSGATSGGTTGGTTSGTTGDPQAPGIVTGQDGGAVQAPPPLDGGLASPGKGADDNSGTRLLALALGGLGLLFLASLLLLLLARRRNKRDDEPAGGVSPVPA